MYVTSGVDPNIGLHPDIGLEYSDFEYCSVSWDKFTTSRICYNDSPYMLYEFLIDSTPTPNLGCCSVSGYSVDCLTHCKESSLLDCIADDYYDFIPTTFVTLFLALSMD